MSGLGQGKFRDEQWEAIIDRGREQGISAAAGSGKTSVLIERICRLLLGAQPDGTADPGSATEVDRLLVVTFTRKAAGELHERLAHRLSELAADATLPMAARQQAQRQLVLLPSARIGTIHSFCAALIQQYGALAAMPRGRLLEESESLLLEHQLATAFLDRALDGADRAATALAMAYGGPDGVGGEDLGAAARGIAGGLRPILLKLCQFSRSLVDPAGWHANQGSFPPLDPAVFDLTHPLVAGLVGGLREWARVAAEATQAESERLSADFPGVRHLELLELRASFLRGIAQAEDWTEFQQRVGRMYQKQNGDPGTVKLSGNPNALGLSRDGIEPTSDWGQRIERRRDSIKQQADKWRDFFDRPWADVALQENAAAGHCSTLWRLAGAYEAEYAQYKAFYGLRDFADLERDSLNLLKDNRVASALRSQLDEVLINEYQDTNELQDLILSLVTPESPGTDHSARARFVVGDVKQSIYSFRLAEPEVFKQLCEQLENAPPASGAHRRLNVNFRSRSSIVDAVNQVFTGLMTLDFGGADYAEACLEYGANYEALGAAGTERAARLHVVVTDAPDVAADITDGEGDSDAGDESTPAAEAAYCRVAAVLGEIHAEGQQVYDKALRQFRPVRWADMAVLMRSTSGLENLRAALAAAHVPHTAEGRSGFYERPEIADILSLLALIDNPLQDVPLAAVLRGPVVALDPAALLEIACRSMPLTAELPAPDEAGSSGMQAGPRFWERLRARALDPLRQDGLAATLNAFLARHAQWRSAAQRMPLPELVWHLYSETGLLIAAAAQQAGAQRHANLLAFHDLSIRFSRFEQQGLARFLEYIRLHRRAAGDLGEADLPLGTANQVQLLTIHKAKGLEFPVVVIPNLQRRFNTLDLTADVLWHKAAGMGAAYVNLRELPTRRWETLAYRRVQSAKRRALLEEELRILYVGMTRARERLEIISAVRENELQAAGRWESLPVEAQSAWHWLGGRILPQSATGNAQAWEVLVHRDSADIAPAIDAEGQPASPVSHTELEAVLRLAVAAYAGPANALPFKFTVSDLAKRASGAGSSADDLAVDYFAGQSEQMVLKRVRPAMLTPTTPAIDALARGTLIHATLQTLVKSGRFRDDCQPADVADAALAAGGRLGLAPGQLIDAVGLAGEVARLCSRLQLAGRLHSEVPLSAAFSAVDLQNLGISHPALTPDMEGMVVVQGTLDLLAEEPGGALILDFKTDRVGNEAELLTRYTAQLQLYAALTQRLLPSAKVRWALYGVESVGLIGPFLH